MSVICLMFLEKNLKRGFKTMIKKRLDYEKKSFDLENVYSAFKKISDNINYISVGKANSLLFLNILPELV